MNTLDVRTCAQWRGWLAKHHKSESEVWLVFHKRHTGRPCVDYHNALDEALCFGWIDSLIKRLDDARYARKFTPRKADSRWSASNRRRYEELRASGRLKAAGINRPPTGRRYDRPPSVSSQVPQYIRKTLARHPAARDYFQQLPPSHRRRYVGWIDSAKQQETKMRRLRQAIELLGNGKKLGLK